ncbi:hypothetical protein WISP_22287 [Willisornis vidua]|uniref:Uncharacterized protein n=1 Tax=Willisornis vidua TaxID=1566151 RepID=A0ABQ9DMW3_9PASS|nr:hypothetical protein WISP_22287 [Willisornis vidua]
MPAGSNMDLLLSKAKPISDSGSTSGITLLKSENACANAPGEERMLQINSCEHRDVNSNEENEEEFCLHDKNTTQRIIKNDQPKIEQCFKNIIKRINKDYFLFLPSSFSPGIISLPSSLAFYLVFQIYYTSDVLSYQWIGDSDQYGDENICGY